MKEKKKDKLKNVHLYHAIFFLRNIWIKKRAVMTDNKVIRRICIDGQKKNVNILHTEDEQFKKSDEISKTVNRKG